MKKMIWSIAMIIILMIGIVIVCHTQKDASDPAFSMNHMVNTFADFYEHPSKYVFYDEDGKLINSYILSKKKAFQVNPQVTSKELLEHMDYYMEHSEAIEINREQQREECIEMLRDFYRHPQCYSLENAQGKQMNTYVLNKQKEFQRNTKKTAEELMDQITVIAKNYCEEEESSR